MEDRHVSSMVKSWSEKAMFSYVEPSVSWKCSVPSDISLKEFCVYRIIGCLHLPKKKREREYSHRAAIFSTTSFIEGNPWDDFFFLKKAR